MSAQRRKLRLRWVNCLAKEGPALLDTRSQCQLLLLYQARKCGPQTPLPRGPAGEDRLPYRECSLRCPTREPLATLIADDWTCGFTAQELDF